MVRDTPPSDPFTVSSMKCRWCEQGADLRFQRRHVILCREHALLVWSVVDEEIRNHNLDLDQVAQQHKQAEADRLQRIREEKAAGERDGFVYYLRVGNYIKIGYASDVWSRLNSYPPDSELLALEHGTLRDEQNLHKQFADLRTYGREWYHPDKQRLLDHIAKVARNYAHEQINWRKRPAPQVLD